MTSAADRIRLKTKIANLPEWKDGTLQALLGIRTSRDLRGPHLQAVKDLLPEHFKQPMPDHFGQPTIAVYGLGKSLPAPEPEPDDGFGPNYEPIFPTPWTTAQLKMMRARASLRREFFPF